MHNCISEMNQIHVTLSSQHICLQSNDATLLYGIFSFIMNEHMNARTTREQFNLILAPEG